jgi:uncharacterized protein YoxC
VDGIIPNRIPAAAAAAPEDEDRIIRVGPAIRFAVGHKSAQADGSIRGGFASDGAGLHYYWNGPSKGLNMSITLQVALFIASVAFIALVACIIPIAFQARRHLEHLVHSSDHLQAKIEILLQDSHEMVEKVNDISLWANEQMDGMGKVLHTIQQWAERGNRFANDVESVIDPPILTLIRNINLLRKGATGFLKTLTRSNGHDLTKKENEHV